MEYVIVATLIGAGWLWNKQNENDIEIGDLVHDGVHQTPYESNNVRRAQELVRIKAKDKFKNGAIIDAARKMNLGSEEMITTLSGNKIPKSKFTHKNMKPFFGSNLTQNMNMNQNKTLLETFTGTAPMPKKKEVKPFFDLMPEEPFGRNIMKDLEIKKGRYNPSKNKQFVLPFEQQQVSSAGSYSQYERDAVMPKSVDLLRTKTNKKRVYEGRVISGKSIVDDRALQPEMFKHRPDNEVENKYILKTTGAFTRAEQRPEVILRNTDKKENHFSYKGNAAPQNEKLGTLKSKTSTPLKQQLRAGPVSNAVAVGQWTSKNSLSDYGKSSIRHAEMNVTEKRGTLSNVVATVKSLIAPFQSTILPTLREEYEANSHAGNVTGPTKLTHYDPDDVTKTTKREQTSNHAYTGVAGSKNKKATHHGATNNASFNELKEYLEINRAPVTTGVKLMAGQETVITTRETSEYASLPSSGITKIRGQIPSGNTVNHDNKRNVYNNDRNQIDTSVIDALKENPYATSVQNL